ncbi:modulator of drug activity B-like family protein [Proteus penneri ATCC 35198]|nr:modulator of drug activity B-like family protein [Proteus penneri ATCC 35198]
MNILLINGGQKFGHSAGQLNRTLHDVATEHLVTLGHGVKETQIEEGYDIDDEIENFYGQTPLFIKCLAGG